MLLNNEIIACWSRPRPARIEEENESSLFAPSLFRFIIKVASTADQQMTPADFANPKDKKLETVKEDLERMSSKSALQNVQQQTEESGEIYVQMTTSNKSTKSQSVKYAVTVQTEQQRAHCQEQRHKGKKASVINGKYASIESVLKAVEPELYKKYLDNFMKQNVDDVRLAKYKNEFSRDHKIFKMLNHAYGRRKDFLEIYTQRFDLRHY